MGSLTKWHWDEAEQRRGERCDVGEPRPLEQDILYGCTGVLRREYAQQGTQVLSDDM